MNWKNVLYLLQVERKSGRLIRGIKATSTGKTLSLRIGLTG